MAAVTQLAASKKAVRLSINGTLRILTSDVIHAQSSAAASQILQSELWRRARSVCLYLSMRDEFQTKTLMDDAFDKQKYVFVPKVHGPSATDMRMVHVTGWDDVNSCPQDKWGIPIPPATLMDGTTRAEWPADEHPVDLVIVPGVAFDRAGGRVGHGKGYYDCWLSKLLDHSRALQQGQAEAGSGAGLAQAAQPIPVLIGTALECQVLDSVPVGPQDVQMDWLAWPGGLVQCSASG